MRGRFTFIIPALLAGAALAPCAMAQDLPAELAVFDAELPGELVNDPTDIVWPTQGTTLDARGVQDPAIPGGGAARRYTVKSKGANAWDAQTLAPMLRNVAAGDIVTVGFYARTLSSDAADGRGIVAVRVQKNGPPYSGFIDQAVNIGPEWKWYEVSGTADRGFGAKDSAIVFQLGSAKQVVEIGQTIAVKGAPSIVNAPALEEAQAASAQVAATKATAELPSPLTGAGTLVNDPANRNWGNSGAQGSFADRAEDGIWLGRATRFSVAEVGENPWDVSAGIPIEGAIAEGDKILIAIAARTVSAAAADGKAQVVMRLQEAREPYAAIREAAFAVGPNWQLIRVPLVASRAFAAGEAQVSLHFADAVQVVDIGPVYVIRQP